MQNNRRYTILLAVMLAFCILTGCEKAEKKVPETVVTGSVVQTYTEKNMITIYSINSDNMTLIPVSVKKEDQTTYTVADICNLVIDNLEEDDIILTSCRLKSNTAYISFSSKGKPIKNCSKKMEKLILEAISNSVLDNIDSCENVVFRCDEKAYQSENRSFEKNEVYASE